MLLDYDDGLVARTPQDAAAAEAAGYQRCATNNVTAQSGSQYGRPCDFYLSPETQSALQDQGGYYTCPRCRQSNDFLHEMPWHGVGQDEMSPEALTKFHAGGGTRVGLDMETQAQIGEDLVRNLDEIPGYGPITWWHEGGSTSPSPLDGATADWGIEVKTLGYDAIHHRFIAGRPREKQHKNEMALQMGKKGILGVLVLLDYRRSVADIYVREYPLERGIGNFRSHQGQHLVKEVPFHNPLMDPHDPSPRVDPINDRGEEMAF